MKANDPFFKKLMDWINPPAPTLEDKEKQATEEAEEILNQLIERYNLEDEENNENEDDGK